MLRYLVLGLVALWWAWFAAVPAHAYPATSTGNQPQFSADWACYSACSDHTQHAAESGAQAACTDAIGWIQQHGGFGAATYNGDVAPSISASAPTDGSWGVVGTCQWSTTYEGNTSVHTTTLFEKLITAYQCTGGGTLDLTHNCVCPAGYTDTGTSCQQNLTDQQKLCQSLKGQAIWGQTTGLPSMGQATCDPSGCESEWGNIVYSTDHVTGITTSEGNTVYTGNTCQYASGQPVTSSMPTDCKNGTYGQINGVWTCVPFDPMKNTVGSTSSGTVTSSVSPSTPGGTGTTSTTTGTNTQSQCNGGSCATTQTTVITNPDGTTSTQTITGNVPLTQWCTDHPNDAACKTSTSQFGGSCSGGFTCSGDSATCAAAQAISQLKCGMVDGAPLGTEAESSLYAAAAASAAQGTGASLGSTTISISSSNFDSSNALGVSAQCVTDLSVTVWGSTQVIELSKVCPWIQTLGTIMLSLAWLSAAVIVGRGIAGGNS